MVRSGDADRSRCAGARDRAPGVGRRADRGCGAVRRSRSAHPGGPRDDPGGNPPRAEAIIGRCPGGHRMDPQHDGTAEDLRVTEIRREIEILRLRIAETIDALEYKADVGSRFKDKVSATSSSVAARVRQRMPSRNAAERPEEEVEGEV